MVAILALLGWSFGQETTWEMRVCADPNDLPMSHRNQSGFENRIAQTLAEELNAELTYDWYPIGEDMIDLRLRQGQCDLIMGVLDASDSLLTTISYYRTTYVFVYREDAGLGITSLDDPVLLGLRIGTQTIGIPPHYGLLTRGPPTINIRDYGGLRFQPGTFPYDGMMNDLVNGVIDVALAWGPVAGYYASRQATPLAVVPVKPVVESPVLSEVTDVSIGVRFGDQSLGDRLSIAIVNRWDDIQSILTEFHVPTEPLPVPQLTTESTR